MNVADLDAFAETGEVTLPVNIMGWAFTEIEIVYRAGFEVFPDKVKVACAQLVKNAQATPALNVKKNAAPDGMQFWYFRGFAGGRHGERAAGAVCGAESGLTMTGISGAAAARAADAMLRTLGGTEVTLLFAAAGLPAAARRSWGWWIREWSRRRLRRWWCGN